MDNICFFKNVLLCSKNTCTLAARNLSLYRNQWKRHGVIFNFDKLYKNQKVISKIIQT